MNLYIYQLLGRTGIARWGWARLDIGRRDAVIGRLEADHDGIVMKLVRLPAWISNLQGDAIGFFKPTIKQPELAALLRDLAVMVECGIPIVEALQSLQEHDDVGANRNIARVARLLLADLRHGATLGAALGRHPDIFPDTVRNLVAIGDETGRVDKMLMESAEHLERIGGILADARQALIYPAFVFAAIFGMAAFWIHYVIPNLASLFKQLNAKLPPLTLAVLAAAEWLTAHAGLVGSLLLLTVLLVLGNWKYNPRFRRAVHLVLHRLPVARVLVTSAGLSFFSEYMSILSRAGVDVIKSLRILEAAMGDSYYRERVIAVRQFVERGDRVSFAMRQVGGFPPMMLRMISVGEDTGSLDRQLAHVANEYRMRFRRVVASLSEIMKPAVIVVAGGIFAFLVVALLLPIYDLVRQTMAAQAR